MYKEVGMPPFDKFYLASRNAAVKCLYAPRFRFSPWLVGLDRGLPCSGLLYPGLLEFDRGLVSPPCSGL